MSNRKIQCITFPRSGHHLLQKILTDYFKDDFKYCEYYHCCKKIPCILPETNFQKSHDFQLSIKNDLNFFYIVQYRHPLEAISSLYELIIDSKWSGIRKDSKEEWQLFFQKKIVYWKKFVHKWIIGNKNPQTQYLAYHDFVSQPVKELEKVIKFINPKEPTLLEKIERIVEMRKVCKIRKLEDFKYFNIEDFQKKERRIKRELKKIGIRGIFIDC